MKVSNFSGTINFMGHELPFECKEGELRILNVAEDGQKFILQLLETFSTKMAEEESKKPEETTEE